MPTSSPDERARRQQEREAAARARSAAAQHKEQERQRRLAHIERRKGEVERANSALTTRVALLQGFLLAGLPATQRPDLSQFRLTAQVPRLQLGALEHAVAAPQWQAFSPEPAGFWKRTFNRAAAEADLERARTAFTAAEDAHAVAEAERQGAVIAKRQEHAGSVQRAREEAARSNAALDDLTQRAARRDKEAIEEFLLRVLGSVPLPSDFPRDVQLAFDVKAEHVVIEWELPGPSCVPENKTVRYVQSRDEITETPRPAGERAELYRGVIAQVCLLVARTVLNADGALQQVSFNGRVRHINTATGHEERPHIISVVIERAQFASLLLDRVTPQHCLRHLHALVSPHPFELEAVEPLVEFDRSRLAFIEGLGMVSSLDARPDLMAMTPTEFEHLIREVLEADPNIESVESLTTRQSNDGGVDGVVYIKQPFGRSMTVVQVKQYARNRSLGPAHIRELIGAMHEVKAGNGLLVTTSDFTAIARASAGEFGRISLIDGNNLVHMIKVRLAKDVLIGDKRGA